MLHSLSKIRGDFVKKPPGLLLATAIFYRALVGKSIECSCEAGKKGRYVCKHCAIVLKRIKEELEDAKAASIPELPYSRQEVITPAGYRMKDNHLAAIEAQAEKKYQERLPKFTAEEKAQILRDEAELFG